MAWPRTTELRFAHLTAKRITSEASRAKNSRPRSPTARTSKTPSSRPRSSPTCTSSSESSIEKASAPAIAGALAVPLLGNRLTHRAAAHRDRSHAQRNEPKAEQSDVRVGITDCAGAGVWQISDIVVAAGSRRRGGGAVATAQINRDVVPVADDAAEEVRRHRDAESGRGRRRRYERLRITFCRAVDDSVCEFAGHAARNVIRAGRKVRKGHVAGIISRRGRGFRSTDCELEIAVLRIAMAVLEDCVPRVPSWTESIVNNEVPASTCICLRKRSPKEHE